MPRGTTKALVHLEEIKMTNVSRAYAGLLLDQSEWRITKKLPVPNKFVL